MAEKLKQAGERVQALERYKELCERRVADLDPQHAFPVQPGHLGQRPAGGFGRQADLMQQKLNEVQGQLIQLGDLKHRLRLTEESLRRETLANEEQRAYIQVLREALELKLTQQGLVFKGAVSLATGLVLESNVDGFVQLVNAQRGLEALRLDYSQLRGQLAETQQAQERREQDLVGRLTRQADEQRQGFLAAESALRQKLTKTQAKKRQLKADKNQLLDYVEDHVQKMQAEEALRKRVQAQLAEVEARVADLREDRDRAARERDNLEDLMKQTQMNVR